MHGAGAHFGIGPVVRAFGRPVFQRRRGDDDAVGRPSAPLCAKGSVGSTQWLCRPHIDLAALDLVDREPLDEERVRALRAAARACRSSPPPSIRRAAGASGRRPRCAPDHAVESSAASSSSFLASALASASIGRLRSMRAAARLPGRLGQAVDQRPAIGLERTAGDSARRAPAPAGAPATERLRRRPRACRPGCAASSPVRAAQRAVEHESARAASPLLHSSATRSPMRSARPRPRRPCASGPRIQRLSSAVSSAGQMARKGAVGGIEEMMAFIEDEPAHAAGCCFLLFVVSARPPAPGRRPPGAAPAHDWR